ncbi:putative DNA polymerase III, clamp loader complex, gamma/delta/delta subunit, replication factor C [Helianthus anomalus]
METYSKVTRFFFICNYISRIIEPLASRCAKFRFKPLSEDIMSTRILHICTEEGLNLDSEALSTLSSISQGDLRRAITFLQGAARLFGSSISSKDLISVSGVIPHEVVQALLAACKSGSFDNANKEVNNVIAEGYPVSQMLSQLFDMVVESEDTSDEQKARICKKFGETDKVSLEAASLFLWGRGKAVYILPSSDPTFALLLVGFTEYDDDDDDDCLVDGADEYLQLLAACSSMIKAYSNMPEVYSNDM